MADNILQHPQFDQYAAAYEQREGLPAGTLRAVAKQESNGNPNAVSNKGAQGAFQFIPATAKAYGVDVANPWDSMRGAAEYLGDNMKKYGRIDAALADYNGGPTQAAAVLQNGSPTYKETQGYVTRIMSNIANAVIPSANAAEPDKTAPKTDANGSASVDNGAAAVTDALKKQAAYKVTAAKIKGISDDNIVSGMIKTAPQPLADVIRKNAEKGVSAADIIKNVGGDVLAEHIKFSSHRVTDDMSNTEKVLAGVGKSFSDIGTGAKQLWTRATGTDDEIRKMQEDVAEQEKLDADLMSTKAGLAGYVGGTLAPTIATMGAGAAVNAATKLPMAARLLQASNAVSKAPVVSQALNAVGTVLNPTSVKGMMASGAVQGALTPTQNDEQGVNSILLGGGAAGVLGTAGKAIARPMGATIAEAAPQVIKEAEALGLPVSAANVAQAVAPRSVAGRISNLVSNPSDMQIANVDRAIANQVGKGVGVEGATAIDSNLLNKSKPFAAFDAATKDVRVPLNSETLQNDLASALEHYKGNTLSPNQSVLGEIDALISKGKQVVPETGIGSARQAAEDLFNKKPVATVSVDPTYTPNTLQEWRSNLGASQASDTIDHSTKELLAKTRDVIGSKMEASLTPEQQAAFKLANEQYANQQALKKAIEKSSNTGSITPSQLIQAAKSGGMRGTFAKGEAPYQELAAKLEQLYGKNGLANKRTAFINSSDVMTGGVGAAMAGIEPSALALVLAKKIAGFGTHKAVDSQNAAVRNLVLGNTGAQRAIGNYVNPLAAALAARSAARER